VLWADTDKFAKFKLTPVQGTLVKPPLIKECLANIECKVIDIVKSTTLLCWRRLPPHDTARKEKRTVHAVGDGTFIVDGARLTGRR